jgi:hypothetical protein
VLEKPPRDRNAAIVWVLKKVRETYAETMSERLKAMETGASRNGSGIQHAGDAFAAAAASVSR